MGSMQNPSWLYTPDWSKFHSSRDLLKANCASEALKAGAWGVMFGAVLATGSGWWGGLPFRESLPMISRTSGVVGSICGLTYGTICISTQIREKDDFINTGIGGFVAGTLIGIRLQSMKAICFYAPMVALGLAGCDFIAINMREQGNKTYEEKTKRDVPFLQWPKRDPFAERWKEIQAREASTKQ